MSDLADLSCICQLNKQHHKDSPGAHAFGDCPEFEGINTVSCLLQLICMTADADLQSVPPPHYVSCLHAAVHVVAERRGSARTECVTKCVTKYVTYRAEEENIMQAMQDANLREQAQADRQRLQLVSLDFVLSRLKKHVLLVGDLSLLTSCSLQGVHSQLPNIMRKLRSAETL